MTKKVAVSIVLISLFCLWGCGIRVTGPCLGYGCSAGSGGAANASNMTPKTTQAQATTAKNAAPLIPDARAGK